MSKATPIVQVEDLKRLSWHARSYLKNVKSKKAFVAGENVSYFEAGRGEPVLLIHGYNGSRNVWRILLNHMLPHYRVIALEVPGLAYCSKPNKPGIYSFRFLLKLLDEFTSKIGLERFHMFGTSAGSTLAAFFALEYGHKVETLTMLGLPSLFKSTEDPRQDASESASFYVPETLEGVDELFRFMYHKPPSVPRRLNERFLQYNIENKELRLQVLKECFQRTTMLVPYLPKLSMPTVFIYGEYDKVTPRDTVDYLLDKVPSIQSYRLLDTGHTAYVENPSEVLLAFNSFIKYAKEATSRVAPEKSVC